MPSDGGLSWNMAWAHQSRANNYQQGTLGWRNNNIEVQGGAYGEKDMMTGWSEALGSIVLMDGELFAANKINDAFVVISTMVNRMYPSAMRISRSAKRIATAICW